tara:strand:- start:978 stop:1391 length:414 start_codon:yes stop_codon:yes gene_type:complete
MKIRIEKGDVPLPKYQQEGDAAFDLSAAESAIIPAGQQKVILTGLKMAIPKGFVGLIWDRSGLAAKNSLSCLGGVIDSGYRGEVGVILRNFGEEDFAVEKGMRIAQMLIQQIIQAEFEEGKLDETKRSEGFGSSGLL